MKMDPIWTHSHLSILLKGLKVDFVVYWFTLFFGESWPIFPVHIFGSQSWSQGTPIDICDCTVVQCLTCNLVMFLLHAFNCWVMLDIEMQADICYTSINWKLSCPFIFTLESSVVIGYPCFNRRKICLFMHDNAFTSKKNVHAVHML